MYARTDRCYSERGSRTNYVRSSIPHCTYKRNINEGSCNHRCRGKAMSITYYSVCVFVALLIHSMKRECAVLSSVGCPPVSYFYIVCHNRHDFRKTFLDTKDVFWILNWQANALHKIQQNANPTTQFVISMTPTFFGTPCKWRSGAETYKSDIYNKLYFRTGISFCFINP
jgi:hypothetical protein